MPQVRKLNTDEQIAEEFRRLNPNNQLISVEKPKRGRPKGTKNKSKQKKAIKGTEIDKTYRHYFIAEACGCRYGTNVIGSGMWCEHKNSMHLEDRKKYSETEYTGI